ncbi:MAG: SRPBCC family protein [Jatrophihabitantaceae bacterium]
MPDLSESIPIRAAAATVYEMVSDLPRMGEWSPENRGARWLGSRAERPHRPALGDRFVGHNRAGLLRWSTAGRVTVADPGREFGFEVSFGPLPVAHWHYRFSDTSDPDGPSCTVTESWTERRPAAIRPVLDALFRARRADLNARGIHRTLVNLKQAAEAAG